MSGVEAGDSVGSFIDGSFPSVPEIAGFSCGIDGAVIVVGGSDVLSVGAGLSPEQATSSKRTWIIIHRNTYFRIFVHLRLLFYNTIIYRKNE